MSSLQLNVNKRTVVQCIFPSWFRSFIGVLMAPDILGWLHTKCRISCHLCLFKSLNNHKNEALFTETNAKEWGTTDTSTVEVASNGGFVSEADNDRQCWQNFPDVSYLNSVIFPESLFQQYSIHKERRQAMGAYLK